jgi:hypothetical protein
MHDTQAYNVYMALWHGDVRYAPAARPGSTKLLVAGSYKRPHTGHWPGPLLNEFLDHVLDPVFLSVSLVYFLARALLGRLIEFLEQRAVKYFRDILRSKPCLSAFQ